MYEAKGNEVYLVHPEGVMELFLTVHHTKDCTLTPEDQAQIIANILNKFA